MTAGLVVFLAIVAAVFWAIGLYNRLVRLQKQFQNAFSQIDVQLKRRHDLIPNVVETARGYIKHERETLEAVIAARSRASSAGTAAAAKPGDPEALRGVIGAEGELSRTLGRLFAVAEAYPDLKANQTMAALMEELGSTENRIAFARQAYNDAVMSYNTACEVLPSSIVAGSAGFRTAPLFEIAAAAERELPRVSFT